MKEPDRKAGQSKTPTCFRLTLRDLGKFHHTLKMFKGDIGCYLNLKTSTHWLSFLFCCKMILGLFCKHQSVQGFREQRSPVGSESTVSMANNLRMHRDKCYRPDGNWLLYKGCECKDHCSVSKMKVAWSSFTTTQLTVRVITLTCKNKLLKIFTWTLKSTNTHTTQVKIRIYFHTNQ